MVYCAWMQAAIVSWVTTKLRMGFKIDMWRLIWLVICLTAIGTLGVQADAECVNRVSDVAKSCSSYEDDTSDSYAKDGFSCFTYTFDGVVHDYIVDLPAASKDAPLIIMLPGYGETAESFRMYTGFYKDAVREGYIVVHVTGAPNPEDMTSAIGWNYNDYDGNNDDVGFLTEFSRYIIEQYSADSTRCFVVGYSNGGFMCHRLALEAADTFSAVVCVSGTMPDNVWEQRPETCDVGVFQVTGESDNTIPKNSDGSAKYARFPAIEEVMDYYAAANNLTCEERMAVGKNSYLIRYSKDETMMDLNLFFTKYNKDVWHLIIGDGYHSWSAESVTGINTNQMILEYLGH